MKSSAQMESGTTQGGLLEGEGSVIAGGHGGVVETGAVGDSSGGEGVGDHHIHRFPIAF